MGHQKSGCQAVKPSIELFDHNINHDTADIKRSRYASRQIAEKRNLEQGRQQALRHRGVLDRTRVERPPRKQRKDISTRSEEAWLSALAWS